VDFAGVPGFLRRQAHVHSASARRLSLDRSGSGGSFCPEPNSGATAGCAERSSTVLPDFGCTQRCSPEANSDAASHSRLAPRGGRPARASSPTRQPAGKSAVRRRRSPIAAAAPARSWSTEAATMPNQQVAEKDMPRPTAEPITSRNVESVSACQLSATQEIAPRSAAPPARPRSACPPRPRSGAPCRCRGASRR
jgi:hypothetical protein